MVALQEPVGSGDARPQSHAVAVKRFLFMRKRLDKCCAVPRVKAQKRIRVKSQRNEGNHADPRPGSSRVVWIHAFRVGRVAGSTAADDSV